MDWLGTVWLIAKIPQMVDDKVNSMGTITREKKLHMNIVKKRKKILYTFKLKCLHAPLFDSRFRRKFFLNMERIIAKLFFHIGKIGMIFQGKNRTFTERILTIMKRNEV